MSDGPNRPPPMNRHWQRLSKSAGNGASADKEVSADASVALRNDLRREVSPELIDGLRKYLAGDRQTSLFATSVTEQTASLWRLAAGRPLAQLLVECAVETAAQETDGGDPLCEAAKHAIEKWALRHARQIDEHNVREADAAYAMKSRRRIQAAIADCDPLKLASELLENRIASPASRPQRQTGIDQGPELGP
jgi:hypothetical protein